MATQIGHGITGYLSPVESLCVLTTEYSFRSRREKNFAITRHPETVEALKICSGGSRQLGPSCAIRRLKNSGAANRIEIRKTFASAREELVRIRWINYETRHS